MELRLQAKTFHQAAGTTTHRVQALNDQQPILGIVDVDERTGRVGVVLRHHILKGSEEPSVVVEIVDDDTRRRTLGVGADEHLQLPVQVLRQRIRRGEVGLDGGQIVHSAGPVLPTRSRIAHALQHLIPIDLVGVAVVLFVGLPDFSGLRLRGLARAFHRHAPGDFLKRRILENLVLNLLDKLDVVELEQLQRLLKLGRDGKRLGELLLESESLLEVNTHSGPELQKTCVSGVLPTHPAPSCSSMVSARTGTVQGQDEVCSKISCAGVRVGRDFRGRPRAMDHSGIDQHGAIAGGEGLAHRVIREQHPDPFSGQTANKRL